MKEVQKERVENRPLIGKLPIEGAYVVGALSGFGVMAACEQGNSWLPMSPAANYPSMLLRSLWSGTRTQAIRDS